jgi:hypothetical protein
MLIKSPDGILDLFEEKSQFASLEEVKSLPWDHFIQ